MSITERLYFTDSHLTQFEARVVAVARDAAGGRPGVILDRTAFYPTGGGQPSDTGTLGAARVIECIDREEAGVLHVIDGSPPEVGASVTGRVDWARRRDHLQQHTGQHILSQAFVKIFGAETRGFRMSEDVSEIDVALPDPTDERITEAVELANDIIWADRPVRVHQVTAEAAAHMPLRKDSAREGELRIIEIEGFDMSPCGGTHAHRTGEVGIVAARSWERAKGLARIEFVAGARALADYGKANRTALGVAALFSVGRDEAGASTARLFEENKRLARRVRELEETVARAEAEQLLAAAVPCRGTVARLVARAFDRRDVEDLKRLAQNLTAHPDTIALLGSRDADDSVRLVFARSVDGATDTDMNVLMREACALLDGRGGGRPELAQGGGRKAEQLAEIIESLARRLSGA